MRWPVARRRRRRRTWRISSIASAAAGSRTVPSTWDSAWRSHRAWRSTVIARDARCAGMRRARRSFKRPMDFAFSTEQNHLRATIRSFAEKEIRPHVMEWDESQHFPVDVFRELGKIGVLGAVFPEDLGGSGYNYVDYSIIMEEIARVDPSIALSLAAHVSLCTNHIYLAGND